MASMDYDIIFLCLYTIIVSPLLIIGQDDSSCAENSPVIYSCQESQLNYSTVFIRFLTRTEITRCLCKVDGSRNGDIGVLLLRVKPIPTSGWNISFYGYNNNKEIAISPSHGMSFRFSFKKGINSEFEIQGSHIDVCVRLQYVENPEAGHINVSCASGTTDFSSAITPVRNTSQMTSFTTKPVEKRSSSTMSVTSPNRFKEDLTAITPIRQTTQTTAITAKPKQEESSCGTKNPVINSCQEGQSSTNSTIFLRFQTTDEQKRCICNVTGSVDRNIQVKPVNIIPGPYRTWNISITDRFNNSILVLSQRRFQDYTYTTKAGIPWKFDMLGLQTDVCVQLQYERNTRASNISVTCEKGLRGELSTFIPAPTTTHTTSITVKPEHTFSPDKNNNTTKSSDTSKTFTRPPSDTDWTPVLLGVSLGIFVLLLTCILSVFLICRKQRRKQKVKTPNEEPFIYGMRDNVLYGTTSDKQDEEPFVYGMRENILYEGFDIQNQCVDKIDATTQSNDQNGKQKEGTHGNQQMFSESHTEDESLGVNVYSEVRQSQVLTKSTARPHVELSTEDRNTVNDVYSEVHKVK